MYKKGLQPPLLSIHGESRSGWAMLSLNTNIPPAKRFIDRCKHRHISKGGNIIVKEEDLVHDLVTMLYPRAIGSHTRLEHGA